MRPPGPSNFAAIARIPRFRNDHLAGFRNGWETYGDLYHVGVLGRDIWVCSNPDLMKEVLVDGRDLWKRIDQTRRGEPFGLRLALGEGLLTTDGPAWQWRRRMINPVFHRELVNGMTATMLDAGETMLARLTTAAHEGRAVNLLNETKHVTQDIISRTMFSSDLDDEGGRVGDAVDDALRYVSKRASRLLELPFAVSSKEQHRFDSAMARIDKAVYGGIERRRRSGDTGDDLLGVLLTATDEETGEGLTDQQIRNEVATIYGAGHETTANALAWAWHELMQNPEILERLHEEVDTTDPTDIAGLRYTRMVLDETLRFRPPVPLNGRVATTSTTLGRFEVGPGTSALLVVNNVHRHPDHWESPETFYPDHFLTEASAKRHRYAYLPFGAGPHMCIGSGFALIEGTLLLALMARAFTFEPAAPLPRRSVTAVTMKPRSGLPTLVSPR
jgi:cytochrome P450